MTKRLVSLIIIFLSTGLLHLSAQENSVADIQHMILGQNAAGQAGNQKVRINTHPDAQWFPEAGLGLFIHFGLAAEHGGIDLSWGMYANKSWEDGDLCPDEYWKIADTWNPKKFNAKKWAKLAKDAGFKYVVFTTKHHDGYALWPSEYGNFSVKQKMGGRDLVKEVIDACRENDLKVGLYFSPPDWYLDKEYINWDFSGKNNYDTGYNSIASIPQKTEEQKAIGRELVRNQVKELLTKYGKIDLFWFDGGGAQISNDEIRAIQPGIVINRRNAQPGDYADSEGVIPSVRFDTWFEANDPCWPERWWSFSYSDRMAKANEVIERLVLMRTWKGNYLANVGPKGNGSMPEEALEAWAEMAKWMKHSGESLFDIQAGDFPEKSNQPITWKNDKTAYVHAFPNFHAAIKVDAQSAPKSVTLLRTGEAVDFSYKENKVVIKIKPKSRSRMVDTVKIDW